MTAAHPPLRTYGRIRSRTLKPRQAGLFDSLLPRISIDLSNGRLDPAALMPGANGVWLEIGFGAGEHLAAQAARHPDILFLAAEPFLNGVGSALRHIDEGGLSNVRLLAGDGRDLLAALPDAGIDRLFILFPDPWPKARHRKRRLVGPDVIAEMVRVLKPGAPFRFATDVEDYADRALEALTAEPALTWTAGRADDWRTPPADHVTTRYEVKGLGDMKPVFFDFVRR
jgi:tRNA (guanine-N7-)-methyltransferase